MIIDLIWNYGATYSLYTGIVDVWSKVAKIVEYFWKYCPFLVFLFEVFNVHNFSLHLLM